MSILVSCGNNLMKCNSIFIALLIIFLGYAKRIEGSDMTVLPIAKDVVDAAISDFNKMMESAGKKDSIEVQIMHACKNNLSNKAGSITVICKDMIYKLKVLIDEKYIPSVDFLKEHIVLNRHSFINVTNRVPVIYDVAHINYQINGKMFFVAITGGSNARTSLVIIETNTESYHEALSERIKNYIMQIHPKADHSEMTSISIDLEKNVHGIDISLHNKDSITFIDVQHYPVAKRHIPSAGWFEHTIQQEKAEAEMEESIRIRDNEIAQAKKDIEENNKNIRYLIDQYSNTELTHELRRLYYEAIRYSQQFVLKSFKLNDAEREKLYDLLNNSEDPWTLRWSMNLIASDENKNSKQPIIEAYKKHPELRSNALRAFLSLTGSDDEDAAEFYNSILESEGADTGIISSVQISDFPSLDGGTDIISLAKRGINKVNEKARKIAERAEKMKQTDSKEPVIPELVFPGTKVNPDDVPEGYRIWREPSIIEPYVVTEFIGKYKKDNGKTLWVTHPAGYDTTVQIDRLSEEDQEFINKIKSETGKIE